MEALTVTDLTCERGGRRLFEGLSFAVQPGGALIVTGPNGAGKSSLLRLLAGLLEPAAGTIDRPERIAWAGHDIALKRDRTLLSELRFWARMDGAADAEVQRAMEAMNVAALADLPCRMLSSGQGRRAALARVVASGAPLWLLDEPTVGLDAASVELLRTVIEAHRSDGGMLVAATHADLGLGDAEGLRLKG